MTYSVITISTYSFTFGPGCFIFPILFLTILYFLLQRSKEETEESNAKLMQLELEYQKDKSELLQRTTENQILTDKVNNLEQDCIKKELIINRTRKAVEQQILNNVRMKTELKNRAAIIKLHEKLFATLRQKCLSNDKQNAAKLSAFKTLEKHLKIANNSRLWMTENAVLIAENRVLKHQLNQLKQQRKMQKRVLTSYKVRTRVYRC